MDLLQCVALLATGFLIGAFGRHVLESSQKSIDGKSAYISTEGLNVILRAAEFAAIKHRHQTRKDPGKTPYINHPLGVARILNTEGGISDPNTIAAALLHDTVEDTETTQQELEQNFGRPVAGIVMEVSDDKTLPKQTRKNLQITTAASKSEGAKAVKLADKIYNLRDLTRVNPTGWTEQRKREYFDWAEKVFQGLRGVNEQLEFAYMRVLIDGKN